MRKDVRTGAIIGGIVIGALIVYAVIASTGNTKTTKPVVLDGAKQSAAGPNSGGVAVPEGPTEIAPPIAAPPHVDTPPTPAPPQDGSADGSHTGGTVPPLTIPGEPGVTPAPAGAGSPSWAEMLAAEHVDSNFRPITTKTPPPAAPKVTTPKVDVPPTPAPGGDIVEPEPTSAGSSPRTPILASDHSAGTPPAGPSNGAGPRTTIPATPEKTHKVAEGETFSSISRTVYGDAKYFKELIKANPSVDPNHLKLGTIINLPDASTFKRDAKPADKDAGAAKHPAPAPVNPKTEYRVQSTDSLYKISIKLYHTPNKVDSIYQLNKDAIGSDPAKLKLGMVLKLPEPPVETASR